MSRDIETKREKLTALRGAMEAIGFRVSYDEGNRALDPSLKVYTNETGVRYTIHWNRRYTLSRINHGQNVAGADCQTIDEVISHLQEHAE